MVRPGKWFVFVLAPLVFAVAYIPQIPFVRNFVKESIRKDQRRLEG